jgi:hypothetical protein
VSLIAVNNIIVVTYCSKWNRLSLSLITVDGITLMAKPYLLTVYFSFRPLLGYGISKKEFVFELSLTHITHSLTHITHSLTHSLTQLNALYTHTHTHTLSPNRCRMRVTPASKQGFPRGWYAQVRGQREDKERRRRTASVGATLSRR